jgi:hypothetical protein
MSKVQYDELNLKKFKMKSILPDATVLLIGKRRSGKCLLEGTKILMYDGSIKNIEDIQIGDLVMGDDSNCRTVLETHFGFDTMYQITNQFNESYTVNSEHTLSLICTYKTIIKERNTSFKIKWFDDKILKIRTKIFKFNNNNKNKVYNTLLEKGASSEIINIPIQTYLSLPSNVKKYLKGYQKPVSFLPDDVPIDPYLYGVIFNNEYKYTINSKLLFYLSKKLPIYNSYLTYNRTFGVYEIKGKLEEFQYNPSKLFSNYKINSFENRLNLLLGMLDVNNYFNIGYLSLHNYNCIDDICFLIKSLGFSIFNYSNKVFIYNGEKCIIKKADFLVYKAPSYILNDLSIENIPLQKYYGFEIDDNSLFLLDNMIVTHNSWLVRDIFYHHKHIPSGIVFSGTEEANPFFSEFVPDCFIHEEYEAEIIEKLMNKQKKRIKDAKKNGCENGKTPANNVFIVFDDMLADAQNWKNDKIIKEIFFNGRHYNFLFILTMQYALAIPPGLRGNIDYVFVFNEPSIKNRRKIYEDYAAMIPSFDHFCNILDACTQNHECLVIKTSGNSSNLQDNIFWYKADAHKNFRVGHYKLWKFHNQHYNKNYEEDNLDNNERVQDLKEKFSNTKKLKVIVSRQTDNIVDLKY